MDAGWASVGIAIASGLGSAAIVAGVAVAKFARMEERQTRTERSIDNFGGRLEDHKERITRLEARGDAERELSRPYIPTDPAAPRRGGGE